MVERRWFVKYKNIFTTSFAVVYGYPDFVWSREMSSPIYKKEIPEEWWNLPIQAYINYFEYNIKPKVRVGHA